MATTKKRILIVDDDHEMATILQKILIKEDYETDIAHDGEEALAEVGERAGVGGVDAGELRREDAGEHGPLGLRDADEALGDLLLEHALRDAVRQHADADEP